MTNQGPRDPRVRPAASAGKVDDAFTAETTDIDVFGRLDTTVRERVLGVPASTTAQPIVSTLSYESRMETALYVARALVAEDSCRILYRDEVVRVCRTSRGYVALDADDTALCEADEVALIVLGLLQRN